MESTDSPTPISTTPNDFELFPNCSTKRSQREIRSLHARFLAYAAGTDVSATEASDLLVRMAPHVGAFVARLFDVVDEADELKTATVDLAPVFEFKKQFVRRRSLKKYSAANPPSVPPTYADRRAEVIVAAVLGGGASVEDERAVAAAATTLVDLEQSLKKTEGDASALRERVRHIAIAADVPESEGADDVDLDLAALDSLLGDLEAFCYYRSLTSHHDEHGYPDWVAFRSPHATDYANLVQIERPFPELPEAIAGPESKRRRRDGFKLTDPRMSLKQAMDEVDYCIYCHERQKDSCRHGFPTKDGGDQDEPARHPAHRLPARRADLGDARAETSRRVDRGARRSS